MSRAEKDKEQYQARIAELDEGERKLIESKRDPKRRARTLMLGSVATVGSVCIGPLIIDTPPVPSWVKGVVLGVGAVTMFCGAAAEAFHRGNLSIRRERFEWERGLAAQSYGQTPRQEPGPEPLPPEAN